MAINREAQRARWRRNKHDQRKREKATKPKPRSIHPDLKASVWAERDKRLRNFPWWVWDLKDGRYYPRQTRPETYPFICDVWAAITLLQHQYPYQDLTNGMIGKFLWESQKSGGVKRASLRTKVPRARLIIEHLEDAPALDFRGPYWPKFPGTVAEHGTGLQQYLKLFGQSLGQR